MLPKTILSFLNRLKKNNSREWMEEHRKEYEKAKADFYSFTEMLIREMATFDSSVGSLKAKDCAFRINRDVRFSKNKEPYKTNMGAYINQNGKKGRGAGYYVHVEPGNIFMAAGVWMPEPGDLAKIRQEIDYNWLEWEKIIRDKSMRKYFLEGVDESDKLVRPPKGYEADNPAIEFIKLKSFIIRKEFSQVSTLDQSFVKTVADQFKSARKMMAFIDVALDG